MCKTKDQIAFVEKWFWKTHWACRKVTEWLYALLMTVCTHVEHIWLSDLAQWAHSLAFHFSRGQSKAENENLFPDLNVWRQSQKHYPITSTPQNMPLFARRDYVKPRKTVKTIRLSPVFEPRTPEIRSIALPNTRIYRQALSQSLHWLSYPG